MLDCARLNPIHVNRFTLNPASDVPVLGCHALPGSTLIRTLALVAVLVMSSSSLHAQMSPGRFAVTALVPQGPDIGVAYAASERTRINLGLGFSASYPDAGVSESSFSVKAGAWRLQPAFEGVSMFYGGSIEFLAHSGSTSTGDFGVMVQAGAEYAISRSFSIGGVVGLGYASGGTSSLGAAGTRLATSEASIMLTWWVL